MRTSMKKGARNLYNENDFPFPFLFAVNLTHLNMKIYFWDKELTFNITRKSPETAFNDRYNLLT